MKKKFLNLVASKNIMNKLTEENVVAALIFLDSGNRERVLKIFDDVNKTGSFDFEKLSYADQNSILELVKQLYKTI